jgi:HEAT repeats
VHRRRDGHGDGGGEPGGLTDERESIDELIAVLGGGDANAADEAEWALKQYGAAALEPLLAAVPKMRYGRLSAIDVLDEIGDPRAAEVLVPMLRDEDEAIREWAALALARLGVEEAVPELWRAYDEVRRRGTEHNMSEPILLRTALTMLGARREVATPRVLELRIEDEEHGPRWRVEDVPEVVEELARARQAIVEIQFWDPGWTDSPSWEFEWSLPWDEFVETTRAAVLEALDRVKPPRQGAVATIDWIDESDL